MSEHTPYSGYKMALKETADRCNELLRQRATLEADNAALRTQLETAEVALAAAGPCTPYRHIGTEHCQHGYKVGHCPIMTYRSLALSRDTSRHEYRPSSDLVGSPCALCRQRPDEHDGLRSEESWNND